MSKSKEKHGVRLDEGEEFSGAKRQRTETSGNLHVSSSPENNQSASTSTCMSHSGEKSHVTCFHEELSIGSSVCPVNIESSGTVGPFVRVKETGELCFLTVRHIFGPFQDLTKFLGKEVLLSSSMHTSTVCGQVIAAEYSESLDVALVKVSENCKPSKIKFIYVSDDNFRETGLQTAPMSPCGNVDDSIDVRDITQMQADTNRVIKFGKASGLTLGHLHLDNGRVTTNNYNVKREKSNYTFTEIVTYTNQLRVVSSGSVEFAREEDVGAAVYLVDKCNRLHCIGMICRIMNDNQGVLVTPIHDIMRQLEQQLEKTLEMVTFHSNNQKAYISELFTHALKEGTEQDRHLRVNIIGFYAQGKTTLTRRLLSESIKDVESTDGIDVHIRRCKMKESAWEKFGKEQEFAELSHRLVSVAKTYDTNAPDFQNTNLKDDDVLDLTKETEDIEQSPKSRTINGRETTTKDNKQSTENKIIYKRVISTEDNPEISAESAVKNEQLFRHFSEELNENITDSDYEQIAIIWDFGGQYVYYATHQIFHSRDAVYLLVFDLRKGLDNVLEDYDFPDRQEKMKTSLKFWVNSINAFVGTDDGTKPKIILIGTHKDKFTGDIDAKFKEVKDLFAGTEVRNHIYERTFAIATLDLTDNAVNELRKTIYQIGEETASGRRIPAKWIPLEMSLLEVRHKNIITFKEVTEMDAMNDHPIEDRDQIKAFLRYHHEKGTLVFFDEEELNNHVILKPQFLIDAFRCIITSKAICDGSTKLHLLWKKMTNMAVLEKEIIDAVWSEDKNTDFFKFSDILLNFLKRHRILAELRQMDDSSGNLIGMGNYMIPSFLKSTCIDATADSFLRDKDYSSTLLGICLENNTVLATVYERITAAALGRWPPIKFKEQFLVFQNVGYYRLDRQHAGKITKVEGKGIELMVIVLCPSGEDIAVVSDRFRRYVEMVISQEFWKLHNDNKEKLYSRYIKCNNPDHNGKGSKESHIFENLIKETEVCCPDYMNHSINVRRTTEEWFQEAKISKLHASNARLVTEMDLNKIAQAIGDNWELLGIALGLTTVPIEHIKQGHCGSGTATLIFYMLKEWKNRNPRGAYQKTLIQAMTDQEALSVNWDKIRNFLDDF